MTQDLKTLQNQYSKYLGSLIAELAGAYGPIHYNQLEDTLKKISPHYLGEQFSARLGRLALTHVKTWIKRENAQVETRNLITSIAEELYTEVCRYFYLDAVLEGKPKKFKKTEFTAFDELCNELCKQAQLAIKNSN